MVLKKLYAVLKLTKACNLDCVYCYESKSENKIISESLLLKCLDEITGISEDTTIILHGGEPMLINKKILTNFLEKGEEKKREGKKISINIQTNGMQIDREWIEILKKYNNSIRLGKGPADKIVKLLMESDEIHFIIGTRINIAHQDPNLPVELEIRRTVVKRIARLLEEKWLKKVSFEYI